MQDDSPTASVNPFPDGVPQVPHLGDGSPRRGEMIGPYKLLEPIAEGGFGAVWLAERREPIVQRVALKIIKAGMDTRAVIARFEQERQALAVMDHPNVAKVFDAGATAAGKPYFVMEHVPGESITTYADRQNLSVRERLELFIPVCEAIQHAHHKGIIHRDIKPSNILVAVREGQPVPKIIDFGVAKAISHTLTDKSIFTEQGVLIGTPEYMSPEQAEMGATDIDTRTDVYSLGVVLYELLSGLLPFDAKSLRAAGYEAIRKILREQDAPKPSTRLSSVDVATGAEIARHRVAEREHLARELRRELDWIPLKALRKDRTQRYDTPADLARDIQRYLDGEALQAGPESAGYRLRKVVKRNKGVVFATAVVLAGLLVGVIGMSIGLNKARLAEDDAVVKRRIAETKTAEAQAARAEAEAARENEAQARRTIDANAYIANIELAQAALATRAFDQVRHRLDVCPERLQGWEWRWLNATLDNSTAELRGHTGEVRAAAFSPDSTRVVTASLDGTARVWSCLTAEVIADLTWNGRKLSSAVFSPNGKRIVTASLDGNAYVWDVANTAAGPRVLWGHNDGVTSASFNQDGSLVVTTSDDTTARVWDADTGATTAILDGQMQRLDAASFSPDGRRIVTVADTDSAWIWDATSGKKLAELSGHTRWIASAVFSPDSRLIATASNDGTARIWDTANGSSLAILSGHTERVNSAAFSPDSMRVVTASWDGTARVWDADTGKLIATLTGHTEPVLSASFSPDGAWIVTCSSDHSARTWNAATGAPRAELRGHTERVTSAAFSPDGTRIVTASQDNTARLWDAAMDPGFSYLQLDQTKILVASAYADTMRMVTESLDGSMRVWDSSLGAPVAELKGHKGHLYTASLSTDGMRLVTTSSDRTARLWDATVGSDLGELGRDTYGRSLPTFSTDGRRVVTTDREHATIWETAAGTRLVTLPARGSRIGLTLFSADSARLFAATDNAGAFQWEMTKGAAVIQFNGNRAPITCAAFSPDGTQIATGSVDNIGRLWNATTGETIAQLSGHTRPLTSVAFSVDGTRIVTASEDHSARTWDPSTGSALVALDGHNDKVTSAVFSADGARILTASDDHTARLWDTATGVCLAEFKGHAERMTSAKFSEDGSAIITISADGAMRVWDSNAYRNRFPNILRARAAAAKMAPIVQARLSAGESIEQLRSMINIDATYSPQERVAAQAAVQAEVDKRQQVANAVRAEADDFNTAAWEAVRVAPATPEDAMKAVNDARRAVSLQPDQGIYLNTLGVALYRASNYQAALDTLIRSDAMNSKGSDGPQPLDRAFIAMARWKLGQAAEARAALVALRELAAKDDWKDDADALRVLAEAEMLINNAVSPQR